MPRRPTQIERMLAEWDRQFADLEPLIDAQTAEIAALLLNLNLP